MSTKYIHWNNNTHYIKLIRLNQTEYKIKYLQSRLLTSNLKNNNSKIVTFDLSTK